MGFRILSAADEARALIKTMRPAIIARDLQGQLNARSPGLLDHPSQRHPADPGALRFRDQRQVDDMPSHGATIEADSANRNAVDQDHAPIGTGMGGADMAFLQIMLLIQERRENSGRKIKSGRCAPVTDMGATDDRCIAFVFVAKGDRLGRDGRMWCRIRCR